MELMLKLIFHLYSDVLIFKYYSRFYAGDANTALRINAPIDFIVACCLILVIFFLYVF